MSAERTRRGISLIELIIVMMLLATMMTLIGPSLSRFMGGRRLTEEARRVMSLTRYARQEAIGRGEPMLVWFDEEEGVYGMGPLRVSGANMLPTEEEERVTLEYSLSEGIRMETYESLALPYGDFPGVVFEPNGALLADGVEEVRLINRKEDEMTLVRLAERPVFVIDDERLEDEYTVQEWEDAGYDIAPSSRLR